MILFIIASPLSQRKGGEQILLEGIVNKIFNKFCGKTGVECYATHLCDIVILLCNL